jgi:hypothetical protein
MNRDSRILTCIPVLMLSLLVGANQSVSSQERRPQTDPPRLEPAPRARIAAEPAPEELRKQLQTAIADLQAISTDMTSFMNKLDDPAFLAEVCPAEDAPDEPEGEAPQSPEVFRTAVIAQPEVHFNTAKVTQLAESVTKNSTIQFSSAGPNRGRFCWFRNGVRRCLIYTKC